MTDRAEDLARRVVTRLNGGLAGIDVATLGRLRSARERALEAHRPQPVFGLAWAGTGTWSSRLRYFGPRYILPFVALLATLLIAIHWQQSLILDQQADTDAALLSGDLPIDAYLDNGLDSWLKRSHH